MACVYCYVARRKGYANPITVFANIDKIIDKLKLHSSTTGTKLTPTQASDTHWMYDFGGNSDMSLDDLISNNTKDLITAFKDIPNSKLTFATKFVNRNLLNYDPQNKTRIRFSLMPQTLATIIDVRTSKIADRINSINDFIEAGYDVDINLAPIVIYPNWIQEYTELLDTLNLTLSDKAKKQLNFEIIFLTHNTDLHHKNMDWHPKAEDLLWDPDNQVKKISRFSRMVNLRYKSSIKKPAVETIVSLVNTILPDAKIRYAF